MQQGLYHSNGGLQHVQHREALAGSPEKSVQALVLQENRDITHGLHC